MRVLPSADGFLRPEFGLLLFGAATLLACGANPSGHDSGSNDMTSGGSATAGGSSTTGGSGGTSSTGGSAATTGGTGGSSGSSGGSVAAGGSGAGGSGGSIPHVVVPCDASETTVVDEWENITFPEIADDGPQAVVIDPFNAANLWVGGSHTGIFKSTDCGATWAKTNTGALASDIDSGGNWNMQIDPNDGTLYTIVGYGTNHAYRSENGGVDWIDLFPEGSPVYDVVDIAFAQEMSLDPDDPTHLAISFHVNCIGEYAPSCIAVSHDRGDNWSFIKGPTSGWVEGASPIMLGGDKMLLSSAEGIWKTTNAGQTWTDVPGEDDWVWGAHQAFRTPEGTWFLGGNPVLTSTDDGDTWTKLTNSGRVVGLVGDGTRLFGSDQWPNGGKPYRSAPLNSPNEWTEMGPTMQDGGDHLAYDPDHHFLYSTNHAAGLWRMRTE
jgi:hypothetical protein